MKATLILLLLAFSITSLASAQSPNLYLTTQKSPTGELRYGYRNADSQLVIPCIYEAAKSFSENYATVRRDGQWAFILRSGQTVVALPGYTDVGQLHAGLAYAANSAMKWGYIDATGAVRIPLIYEATSDFNLFNIGSARVMKPGTMQYITIDNPLLENGVAIGQSPLQMNGEQSGSYKFAEALQAYNRGDYNAAFAPATAAAAIGNPKAMSLLGTMYHGGKGCAKDDAAALRYWRKAAHRGEQSALTCMGLAYDEGIGTAVNYQLALFYYQHAASLGNAFAMKKLGLLYLQGHGVEKSDWTAVSWFEKAAPKGDVYSAYCVGFAALFGVGHSRDTALARKWLGVAAAKQYRDAQTLLYDIDHPKPVVMQGRYNKDFMNDYTPDQPANRPQSAPERKVEFHFPQPTYAEQLQEQRNRDYYNDISKQERETRHYNDKYR